MIPLIGEQFKFINFNDCIKDHSFWYHIQQYHQHRYTTQNHKLLILSMLIAYGTTLLWTVRIHQLPLTSKITAYDTVPKPMDNSSPSVTNSVSKITGHEIKYGINSKCINNRQDHRSQLLISTDGTLGEKRQTRVTLADRLMVTDMEVMRRGMWLPVPK